MTISAKSISILATGFRQVDVKSVLHKGTLFELFLLKVIQ